jgi:hypothetical protein
MRGSEVRELDPPIIIGNPQATLAPIVEMISSHDDSLPSNVATVLLQVALNLDTK